MFTRQHIKFDTLHLHELYCIEAVNDEVEIETDLSATLAITITSFPSITKFVYGRSWEKQHSDLEIYTPSFEFWLDRNLPNKEHR